MMNFLRNWASRSRDQSGQALIEFMFVGFILLFLLFGMIDFSRAISTRQTLINLSRESANLAARGTGDTTDAAISNAIAAAIAGAAPLSLTTNGLVIISAVLNSNGVFLVTNQIEEGALSNSAPSKIAPGGIGSIATMPPTAVQIPQTNQIAFVSEVYYSYQPVTPIGRLLNFTMTNALYDAAIF
jgi:Flp pilus assembly protein TadG